jgi:D-galactarolactone cycloisomerase
MLLGEDPIDVRRLWRRMFVGFGAARGRGSEGGLAVNAMAALDIALWDLAGKALGVPVYRLLGGAVQPEVMAYASSSAFLSTSYENSGGDARRWIRKSPAELEAECRTYVEQGFRAVKFGWGNSFTADDEERFAAIRGALGPDVRLMFDFGCPAYWGTGWNAAAAIRAARILERYGAYFWEEPLPPRDVAGYRTLADAVELNIATGESITLVEDFEQLIDARAVDIIQPDAAQMGITQFSDIGRRAQQAGVLVVPHSPWSGIVVAAHVNLLAAMPNGAMIEYPAMASFEPGSATAAMTEFFQFELVERPPVVIDGMLQLPDGPGLGVGGYRRDSLERLAKGEITATRS